MSGEELESGGRKICGLGLEGRLGVWRGDSEFAYRGRILVSVKEGLAPHRHLQVESLGCLLPLFGPLPAVSPPLYFSHQG